jgi:hypothetical protein
MNDSTLFPAISRALLPEVLFADDIALALRIPKDQAELGLGCGAFGTTFQVEDELAVLRRDFLATVTRNGFASLGSGEEVGQ